MRSCGDPGDLLGFKAFIMLVAERLNVVRVNQLTSVPLHTDRITLRDARSPFSLISNRKPPVLAGLFRGDNGLQTLRTLLPVALSPAL